VSAAARVRERTAWVTVTAVLATSLAWTGVALAALAARSCVHCPPAALTLLRALGRALVTVSRAGAPALAPAVTTMLAAALVAALLLRGAVPEARKAHHGG
jgi:hypothetical protein